MEKLSENQKIIRDDILRYKKNKLAQTFAILSIVFNCLYFCLLYAFNNSFFYTIEIGASVIITLATLLVTFLSSEGVKGYNKKYSIVLLVLAVIQIARIFILPLDALLHGNETTLTRDYFGQDISGGTSFAILTIWLSLSAICLIVSAVWGYIVSKRLEIFREKLDRGEISVEATLKEMDAEEAAKTQEVR